MTEPFNPLDLVRLGESVARALLAEPTHPLPPREAFEGSGIYALYYRGDFPPYRLVADANRDEVRIPMYVGKAIPAGRRRGGAGFDIPPEPALYRRLQQHAQSIEKVNLEVSHFVCQYLIVAPVWIPLGEEMLIRLFSPLWNGVVDGFGNHDPGKGRYNQQRSLWDVLHPGRKWAGKLQPNPLSARDIKARVRDALANLPA